MRSIAGWIKRDRFLAAAAKQQGIRVLVSGAAEAKIEKLTLADLPERPPRTTRLRIKAQPVSDMEVKIRIKDLGFGEIFKSSDKTWEYMMSLENVQ